MWALHWQEGGDFLLTREKILRKIETKKDKEIDRERDKDKERKEEKKDTENGFLICKEKKET